MLQHNASIHHIIRQLWLAQTITDHSYQDMISEKLQYISLWRTRHYRQKNLNNYQPQFLYMKSMRFCCRSYARIAFRFQYLRRKYIPSQVLVSNNMAQFCLKRKCRNHHPEFPHIGCSTTFRVVNGRYITILNTKSDLLQERDSVSTVLKTTGACNRQL